MLVNAGVPVEEKKGGGQDSHLLLFLFVSVYVTGMEKTTCELDRETGRTKEGQDPYPRC